MTQHEQTMQDLNKIKDLLIISDKLYDLVIEHGDRAAKKKAIDLLSLSIEVSSGRHYN